jgi:hypothetical protein
MLDRPPGPIRWGRQAKPGGGERRIARLDPFDDETYRRLVARIVPRIEGSLGSGVIANRATRDARLRPWPGARRAWRRALRAAATREDDVVAIAGDVRDCYGSVRDRALAPLEVDDELSAFLRALWDRGVDGLPVGPDPSAILANGILAIADREAAAAGCRPIRWVDDVVFVAAGRRTAQRAFDAWRRALEGLGLEAHDGKTRRAVGRADALDLFGRADVLASDAARRGIIAPP